MHQLGQFRVFCRYLFGQVLLGVPNGLFSKRVSPCSPFFSRRGFRPGGQDRRNANHAAAAGKKPDGRSFKFRQILDRFRSVILLFPYLQEIHLFAWYGIARFGLRINPLRLRRRVHGRAHSIGAPLPVKRDTPRKEVNP